MNIKFPYNNVLLKLYKMFSLQQTKTNGFHTTMFFLNSIGTLAESCMRYPFPYNNVLLKHIKSPSVANAYESFHTTMFFLNRGEINECKNSKQFPYNNVLLKQYKNISIIKYCGLGFHTTMFFLNGGLKEINGGAFSYRVSIQQCSS